MPRVFSVATAVGSVALLTACSNVDSAPAPRARPAGELEVRALPDPVPPVPQVAPPRRVEFRSDDGVLLVGELRVGATPMAVAALLVHQLGATHAEWDDLVAALPGMTVLSFDLRGHGESTHQGDQVLDYQTFSDAQWADTARDVRAALKFLAEDAGVQPPRIAIVGSSIGATAVTAAAAEDPRASRFVLLSPGRAYRGFDGMTPAVRLAGRPGLIFAGSGDLPSAEAARDLARITELPGSPVLVDGDAHGVAILRSSPEARRAVVEFLRGE